LYRRSLYTFWRRSVAPANFFDVPARQVCSVKPQRTSTPLHAPLTTLNDATYVEAARAWAEKLITSLPDDAKRLKQAFLAGTSRHADDRDLRSLQHVLGSALVHYSQHKEDAAKLIATGDSRNEQQAADS